MPHLKALKFMSFKHSTCRTEQICGLAYTQWQQVWDPTPSPELEKILFLKAANLSVTSQVIFLFRKSDQWIPFLSDVSHRMQKQRQTSGSGRKELKILQPISIALGLKHQPQSWFCCQEKLVCSPNDPQLPSELSRAGELGRVTQERSFSDERTAGKKWRLLAKPH